MELDEHEQGELVQKWLRQNGSSLITGVLMGLALVLAWQWWQGRGAHHQQEAAVEYASFTQALEARNQAKARTIEALLASKYADTPYADLAYLREAAFLVNAGKADQAIKLLQSARSSATQADMKDIMGLRLARAQLIAGKPTDARKTLDALGSTQYPAIAAELHGDIASLQGHRDDARKAYQQALTTLDQAAPTRALLELKLIDAGGNPPAKPES